MMLNRRPPSLGYCWLLLLLLSLPAQAQTGRVTRHWLLSVQGGMAGYHGDLSPQHVGWARRHLAGIGPYAGIGLQHRLSGHWSAGGFAGYAEISGSDFRYGKARSAQFLRNLHFRNGLALLGLHLQWEPWAQVGYYGSRRLLRPYLQAGLQAAFSDPRATGPDGRRYRLREVGTEGQHLPGGKAYARLQPTFPLELGLQLRLSERLDLVPHLRYQFTFTDYLDDVSGAYLDAGRLARQHPLAAALADRSMEAVAAETGAPRRLDGFEAMAYTGADGLRHASLHGFPQGVRRGDGHRFDQFWMLGLKLQWATAALPDPRRLSRLHRPYDATAAEKPSRRVMPDEWVASQQRHAVVALGINTPYTECVSGYFREGILFDSDRPDARLPRGRRKSTHFNVYYAPFVDLPDGVLTAPVLLEDPAYAGHNLSHAVALGRDTLLAALFEPLGRGVPQQAVYWLHARAERLWEHASALPFSSDRHSVSQPSLSPDGRTLWVASDMPGGQGGTDLYVSRWENGAWSPLRNAGPTVNTPGDELYPFIHADGTLYFASDGHPGMGGLDLFEAAPDGQGGFRWVRNLGMPINSRFNDYALIANVLKRKGFFSSDRPGGQGGADIYAFQAMELDTSRLLTATASLVRERVMVVEGIVVDGVSQKPIPGAYISVTDDVNDHLQVYRSDEQGIFSFEASSDGIYRISSSMLGYSPMEMVPLDEVGLVGPSGDMEVRLEMHTGRQKLFLKGRITVKGEGGQLQEAKVRLVAEEDAEQGGTVRSDASGEYRFKLKRNLRYRLVAEKDGFQPATYEFSTFSRLASETIVVNLELERIPE